MGVTKYYKKIQINSENFELINCLASIWEILSNKLCKSFGHICSKFLWTFPNKPIRTLFREIETESIKSMLNFVVCITSSNLIV